MIRHATILAVLPSLAACASLPDVTLNYYAPQAQARLSVVQALDCGPGASLPVSAYTISASAPAVSADRTRPYSFRLADLDSTFSDTDFSASLTEDGRLKSINGDTIGEAEATVKSAIAFGTSLSAFAAFGPVVGTSPGKAGPQPTACSAIAKLAGNKPLTLTYSALIDSRNLASGEVPLAPAKDSATAYDALQGFDLPDLHLLLRIGPVSPNRPAVTAPSSLAGAVPLTIAATASVHLEVIEGGGTLWSEDVVLPARGDLTLPVPHAVLFGKQSFQLTLADSGAITALSYGKQTGSASILNAGTAIGNASAPASAADAAAALKSQSDVIAQTARLARCRANPATCT